MNSVHATNCFHCWPFSVEFQYCCIYLFNYGSIFYEHRQSHTSEKVWNVILIIGFSIHHFICNFLCEPELASCSFDFRHLFWTFQPIWIIIIISGLHHYECIVPLAIRNLQNGWFWAALTAVRLWDSRSFRTVFIHVIRGRPGSVFQSSGRSAVRIFLASALSFNHAMCPNGERHCAWIVEVRRGWPLSATLQRWKQTGTIWCLRVSADTTALSSSSLRPSTLLTAQHSEPYRLQQDWQDTQRMLYNFSLWPKLRFVTSKSAYPYTSWPYMQEYCAEEYLGHSESKSK